MIDLGYQALNIAFVLAGYSALLYFWNAPKPYSNFIKSAHRALVAQVIFVVVASIALFYALFTNAFQIEYVAHYSNRSLSWFYKFAAFWAGQAGSLLLWALLLAIFGLIVLIKNRRTHPSLSPWALGIISATSFFFLYLLVFKSNPFSKLPFTPQDGTGLNPLLQNPEMIFHPPSLYVGFVGFTVPFAFAMAALFSGQLDESWIRTIRRWTLFSWLFLTIGNILGMQWAYVELGWGGYWAWDPVENSSLLPWLTCTAFLHSVVVQERKGMLKKWNMALVIITFALTIFGTFVTRSGLISSVHAFGVSDLGPAFLLFLALILIVSTILMIKRIALLQSPGSMVSWTSKESSFMLSNVLFIAITLGVFIGTLLPTITEAVSGTKMSVDRNYFNRLATFIGLAVFLLIGVCTMLSWGRTRPNRLLRLSAFPLVLSVIVTVVLIIFGINHMAALISFFIGTFAISVTLIDLIRSIRARKQRQKLSLISACLQLVNKHKRRYGGYIVHLGVLLFFIGIVGSSAFSTEKTQTLRPGESVKTGQYELVYQGLVEEKKDMMDIVAARFEILKNGKDYATIRSEKHIHPNFQPVTEVGIRSALTQDIYVILADYETSSQMATIGVLINPLVMWIWIGGIIIVIGTLIALSPQIKKQK